jgi:sfeI DNA methyltransferase
MKNISIKSLLKEYDPFDIEKALIVNHIRHYQYSLDIYPALCEYVSSSNVNQKLADDIAALHHVSLDDIIIDMELLIPSNDKKTNGAFFTPSYIVDYIINHISPKESDKIADVSCGSGAFIIGAIKYLKLKYNKPLNLILRENIYGADILPYNVRRTKMLIMLYALSINEIVKESDINILNIDSLKYNWDTSFDAIIGNPPYVKFQDLEDDTRNYLLNNWETTKFGTYNLYFAFFELGLKLLSNKGKLGYITPNNYFTSLSGECLRSYFQHNRCIESIVDFNSTKVFDVQTYTAITFINKNQNEFIKFDRIAEQQIPQDFLKKVSFTNNSYDDLNVKKWRLLCGSERDNISKIENIGSPIGELFNICVGIATLKDEVYFIDPVTDDGAYFEFVKNGKNFKIEKEVTKPLVKISDMKSQDDVSKNQRRIIFPYEVVSGKPVPIEELDMKDKYPMCYEYLNSVKDVLVNRGKGKHIYKPFYAYGRTQGLNRKGIKILTPTFSQYPRFLLDNQSDGFFTNGYGIYFYNDNKSLFSNPITLIENSDVLLKILNSYVMHYYIKKTSVSIEGGYPCYQKNFIEKFSIPSLTENEISEIRELNTSNDIDNYLINLYHLNFPEPNRCS